MCNLCKIIYKFKLHEFTMLMYLLYKISYSMNRLCNVFTHKVLEYLSTDFKHDMFSYHIISVVYRVDNCLFDVSLINSFTPIFTMLVNDCTLLGIDVIFFKFNNDYKLEIPSKSIKFDEIKIEESNGAREQVIKKLIEKSIEYFNTFSLVYYSINDDNLNYLIVNQLNISFVEQKYRHLRISSHEFKPIRIPSIIFTLPEMRLFFQFRTYFESSKEFVIEFRGCLIDKKTTKQYEPVEITLTKEIFFIKFLEKLDKILKELWKYYQTLEVLSKLFS